MIRKRMETSEIRKEGMDTGRGRNWERETGGIRGETGSVLLYWRRRKKEYLNGRFRMRDHNEWRAEG